MTNNRIEQEKYNELAAYTLLKHDVEFIHQYVVDAWAAQTADENTKPIKLTFALVGLYLYIEKSYTGKNVQRVHILLARRRKQWPHFSLPENRGSITVADVMNTPAGDARDQMIHKWCESVWTAFKVNRTQIIDLIKSELK